MTIGTITFQEESLNFSKIPDINHQIITNTLQLCNLASAISNSQRGPCSSRINGVETDPKKLEKPNNMPLIENLYFLPDLHETQ